MESIKTRPGVAVEEISTPDAYRDAIREEGTLPRLSLLWQHRLFLGKALLVGFALSIVLAFLIPKKYEATARLMPPDNRQPSALAALATVAGSTAPGLGGLVGDLVGGKTTSATFVGVLQSRTVADHVIQQFDLQKVYWTRHPEDARKVLKGRTNISEDRKSGIITITVTDKDPQRASAMAQAYVTELDRLVALLATSAARRERQFLEGRLQGVKQELEQAEVDLSQFSSKNTTLDLKEQGKAMLEAAARVQGELIATQTEVQALKQVYTDSNVRVRAAQARVNELQRKLNQLGGQSAGRPPSPAEESSADFNYPSIRQLPVLGVTYTDLYRRTKIAEIVFELLTRQYEMAKVEEAKEIPTVKELDVPVVPEKMSFPPRGFVIFCGTFLFVSGAAGWILGRRTWQETDAGDPRKQLLTEIFLSTRNFVKAGTQRHLRRSEMDRE